MYPKILILGIACCFMFPFASGQIVAATCNETCTEFEMICTVTKTINRCTEALDSQCDWMINILDDLVPMLQGGLVVTLTIATRIMDPSIGIGLLNVLLAIICWLINIIVDWSQKVITTDEYKTRIAYWFNVSQLIVSNYSSNPVIFIAIHACLMIIINLYETCIMNMY